jgi:hypothetical protein
LIVGAISIAGNNAPEFVKTGDTCSNASVPAGGNCAFAVSFAPAAGGSRTAGVSIPSNAEGSPHLVTLSGTGGGVAARIGLAPSSVGFGDVGVGLTSEPQTVTLSNDGTTALIIGQLSISGPYAQDFGKTSDKCSVKQLMPGESCTVKVAFAPNALGLRTAALMVSSNAGGSPHTVSLSGTGADRIAPRSTISTKPGAVLIGGPIVYTSLQSIQGRTTDDLSGVGRVEVTFTPELTGDPTMVVVDLDCPTSPRGCNWTAAVPWTPGRYEVTVKATDAVGNVETEGPLIMVIVV